MVKLALAAARLQVLQGARAPTRPLAHRDRRGTQPVLMASSVANRGEIAGACPRLRHLGLATVPCTPRPDVARTWGGRQAIMLGPPRPRDLSRHQAILHRPPWADAIHPGYGFSSENWRFASGHRGGPTFIGPPAEPSARWATDEGRRLMAGRRRADGPGRRPTRTSPTEALAARRAIHVLKARRQRRHRHGARGQGRRFATAFASATRRRIRPSQRGDLRRRLSRSPRTWRSVFATHGTVGTARASATSSAAPEANRDRRADLPAATSAGSSEAAWPARVPSATSTPDDGVLVTTRAALLLEMNTASQVEHR